MATIKFVPTVKNSMAQVIVNALDAGAGAGKLLFYTGTQPASAADAVTSQTLLGTLTLSDPSATIASGVITFSAITQDSAADATGTATWARLTDSTDATVGDLDVSDGAGTGAIKLNTVSIAAGGPILMSSLTIAVGA